MSNLGSTERDWAFISGSNNGELMAQRWGHIFAIILQYDQLNQLRDHGPCRADKPRLSTKTGVRHAKPAFVIFCGAGLSAARSFAA
jgi:3-mercaptopyruvate sulfurtransferase SseA